MSVSSSKDTGGGFTNGRYMLADTDAAGARDVIELTAQVKFMRERMETSIGSRPGLILVVVHDAERKAAVARILRALDEGASGASD